MLQCKVERIGLQNIHMTYAYGYDMVAAQPEYHVYFALTENNCMTARMHTRSLRGD